MICTRKWLFALSPDCVFCKRQGRTDLLRAEGEEKFSVDTLNIFDESTSVSVIFLLHQPRQGQRRTATTRIHIYVDQVLGT